MTTLPWLPTTAITRRLEADLKARGWKVWWNDQGGLDLTAPDGKELAFHCSTTARTMSDAYAGAQEYANALTKQAIDDAYGRGDDLGSVRA